MLDRVYQQGLTLLEVLIALSIFALIGVASFQVLSSVIDSQQIGDSHSLQLARFQKAMLLIDGDLQQLVARNIRTDIDQEAQYLLIKSSHYALELTRGGRANPLQLSRSSMQRVAYDLGPHPESADSNSEHYRSQQQYLRRHYWQDLDHTSDSTPRVQVLLADVEDLAIALITDKGRYIQWPLDNADNDATDDHSNEQPIAIEFSFTYPALGKLSRFYKVN
jgi:general secretion pathway protein J